MSFPTDLIRQCLTTANHNSSIIGDDDTEMAQVDVSSLLQLVLSVMEDIPPTDWNDLQSMVVTAISNNNHKQSTITDLLYRAMTMPDLDTSQVVLQIQQKAHSNQHTWSLGLSLMALLLRHSTMTAFEVHSVALQQAAAMEHGNECLFTLVMLLCVWSLNKCQNDIQHQQATGKRIRWKRMQSLILETIQTYQRHVLRQENEFDEDGNMDENDNGTTINTLDQPNLQVYGDLWMHHVQPAGISLWKQLPEPVRGSLSSVFWPAISLNILSHLAGSGMDWGGGLQAVGGFLLLQQQQQQQQENWGISLDDVWAHPWRVASFHHQHQQQQQQRQSTTTTSKNHARLEYWTLERQQTLEDGDAMEDHDADDDDDSNVSSVPPDEYDGIDTSWNDVGVALLAWQVRQVSDTPLVVDRVYEWRLWFPHVAILLNSEDHPTNGSQQASLQWMKQGIDLLQDLLPKLPAYTLAFPTSFSLATATANNNPQSTASGRHLPPDNPVGTLQLLLNGIVMSSASNSTKLLPSAMRFFGLCKSLLSKYEPSAQVSIVLDHLLPQCPHPGLRPKILDLLRPLVAYLSTGKSTYQGVLQQLWKRWEVMIVELGKYCSAQQGNEAALQLKDVEDLIDQGEYMVSVCAMMQLSWTTMVHSNESQSAEFVPMKHPMSINLLHNDRQTTLSDFYLCLQQKLEQWQTGKEGQPPPQEFFRLNLLDSALQQLQDLPEL